MKPDDQLKEHKIKVPQHCYHDDDQIYQTKCLRGEEIKCTNAKLDTYQQSVLARLPPQKKYLVDTCSTSSACKVSRQICRVQAVEVARKFRAEVTQGTSTWYFITQVGDITTNIVQHATTRYVRKHLDCCLGNDWVDERST